MKSLTALLALSLPVLCSAEISAQIAFEETTDAAGISYMGARWGAAWGDFDGDGAPDLYTSNHASAPSLYLNHSSGTFTDVASHAIPEPAGDTHTATWMDFDNDGDQDLLEVLGGRWTHHLFVNVDGTLVEQAGEFGLDHVGAPGRSTLWYDWNRDGWLDVLMLNDKSTPAPTSLFENNISRFENVTSLSGLDVERAEFAHLFPTLGEDDFHLFVWPPYAHPHQVYDAFTVPFEDLTDVVGLPATNSVRDVAIADFNGDQLPDLFLARGSTSSDVDQSSPTRLDAVILGGHQRVVFRTSGNVSFHLLKGPIVSNRNIHIGAEGIHPASRRFLLSPTDPDVWGIRDEVLGTSHAGAYVGYEPATGEWTLQVHTSKFRLSALIESTEPISDVSTHGFAAAAPSIESQYLENAGDSGFRDRTSAAIGNHPMNCWSVAAGDFDNDMDTDLYVACSHLLNNLPNVLYENRGDGTFQAVPGAGGAQGSAEGQSEAVAVADFDLDGFLDLFVTNGHGNMHDEFLDGKDQLFRNLGNDNHWLEIDLEGVSSNRDGIGSVVTVTAGGVTQQRFQLGGAHGFSQDAKRLHFGLAGNRVADKLTIQWPSGIAQELRKIPADQILRVIEPVQPSLLGKPIFSPGVDSGVYVWKDEMDGPYHLRVSGAGSYSEFDISIVAEAPFERVTPLKLNEHDEFEWTDNFVRLRSRVTTGEDGLEFSLPPNVAAFISVENDGKSNPRQLHVGASGGPLPPSGWITRLENLSALPDFDPGVDLGLFLGRAPETGSLNARWNGDGLTHQGELTVISSQPILEATPIRMEENGDSLVTTGFSVAAAGAVRSGFDGVDIALDPEAKVALAYTQDRIFQPHRVHTAAFDLGQPNGYWLPIASAAGMAQYDPAEQAYLFLWKEDAVWHVRATAGGGRARYAGRLTSTLPASRVAPVSLEVNDILDWSDPTQIVFELQMGRSFQDGFDFEFPEGAQIFMELEDNSAGAAAKIRMGEAGWPVGKLPVELTN